MARLLWFGGYMLLDFKRKATNSFIKVLENGLWTLSPPLTQSHSLYNSCSVSSRLRHLKRPLTARGFGLVTSSSENVKRGRWTKWNKAVWTQVRSGTRQFNKTINTNHLEIKWPLFALVSPLPSAGIRHKQSLYGNWNSHYLLIHLMLFFVFFYSCKTIKCTLMSHDGSALPSQSWTWV